MRYPHLTGIYLLLNDNTNTVYDIAYVCSLLDFNKTDDVLTAVRDGQIVKPVLTKPFRWTKKELLQECLHRLELQAQRVLILELPPFVTMFDYAELLKCCNLSLTFLKRQLKQHKVQHVRRPGTRKHYFSRKALEAFNAKQQTTLNSLEVVSKDITLSLDRA